MSSIRKEKKQLNFQDIRLGLTLVYSSLLVDNPVNAARYLNCIDTYTALLETWRKSGLSMSSILHRVNIIKLHYVRYLGGNPLTQTFTEVKVTSGGLPTSISFMPLESLDLDDIRFNLTVLSATRAITLDLDPDIQPIVGPATGLLPKDLCEFTDDWLNKVVDTTGKLPPPKDNLFEYFHETLKRGPQGHALGGCYSDLISLIKDCEGRTILKSLCTLGGSAFCKVITHWLRNPASLLELAAKHLFIHLPPDTMFAGSIDSETMASRVLRKLGCIADKNGKTRIIALFDYWSQTVLQPVHDYIMHLLTHFPDDCTYQQGEKLKDYPQIKLGGKYWCFDLKSATDRFPLSYQVLVLRKLLGSERAEAWRQVMVDLPFESPVDGKPIKFAVGQPLGAYSSWAVFTLSHHVLIHYCAFRNGISAKGQYVILGDDIVIFSRKIARTYVSILTIMGVEINKNKSLISYSLCEFAKRYWYKGVEITPFPISGLLRTYQKIYLLIPFIESLVKINWLTQEGLKTKGIIPIILSVYKSLGLQRTSRFARKAKIFLITRDVLSGRIPECDGLHAITDLLSLPNLGCNHKTSFFGLTRLKMNFKAIIGAKNKRLRQTVGAGITSYLANELRMSPKEESFRAGIAEIKGWVTQFMYRLKAWGFTVPKVDFEAVMGKFSSFEDEISCRQISNPYTTLTISYCGLDDIWIDYLMKVNSGEIVVTLDTLPTIPYLDGDLIKSDPPDVNQDDKHNKEIQIFGYKVVSMIRQSLRSPNSGTTLLLTCGAELEIPECNPDYWMSYPVKPRYHVHRTVSGLPIW